MRTFYRVGYCFSMIAFLICCFWRADIGASFVAGIAICAFYLLINMEEKKDDSNGDDC